MALWLVRAGKHGEDEHTAIEKGIAIIGWLEMPDLSNIDSFEEMKDKYSEIYPDVSRNSVINSASQLWAFTNKIQKGEYIVLPLKSRSLISVGKVIGDYLYQNGRHTRKVEWVNDSIPRNKFGQDLLYSFGAYMTVCQIQRNDAEDRVMAILEGKPDPHFKGTLPKVEGEPIQEDELIDLEEQSFDQTRKIINAKFKGHNLARLVEAILNTQGYETYRPPDGPDGGIDILAGFGHMGFDTPRICVQVKSGGVQKDSVVRELEGVMNRVGANQGLLVSWDGFNKNAIASVKEGFFKVRLWDDKKLIQNLQLCYEKLPDEIQTELPLKRIWVVVPED